MTAHLLTIGDEILIGQIVDTNSAWMSQALNLAGIAVTGKSSVGDTRSSILDGITHAMRCAPIVIMTGGLGPTKDDITKKTLAERFHAEMVFHQETYDRIAAYFEKVGRPLSPSMVDQATLPSNAQILTNKVGTAPGMWFETGEHVLISLPGVPFEMEYLMTHEVIPRLKQKFTARPIEHRTIQTAGEGESNIAHRIESFEDSLPPHIKLAYLPALGQVRLRLTGIWPGDVTEQAATLLQRELDEKAAELERLIPDLVFGRESDTLQAVIGKKLMHAGLTLGTAESCTGGYIAHLMTTVPGASAYFMGSVVVYSNQMKTKLLHVDPNLIEQHGAVSEATVCAMAQGALSTLGVDVAVAVSGIAGPDGGTPEKPVGTVWVAVSYAGRTKATKLLFGRDRVKNIHLAAIYALNLVNKILPDSE